ncbi:hypothetical protein MRX96_037247 [Rhipicephalus microplus]
MIDSTSRSTSVSPLCFRPRLVDKDTSKCCPEARDSRQRGEENRADNAKITVPLPGVITASFQGLRAHIPVGFRVRHRLLSALTPVDPADFTHSLARHQPFGPYSKDQRAHAVVT